MQFRLHFTVMIGMYFYPPSHSLGSSAAATVAYTRALISRETNFMVAVWFQGRFECVFGAMSSSSVGNVGKMRRKEDAVGNACWSSVASENRSHWNFARYTHTTVYVTFNVVSISQKMYSSPC